MANRAILSFGMRLILASASPRRAELLRAAGFQFETCVTDIDEGVRPGESPRDYVRRLAIEKSAAALAQVGPADQPPLRRSAEASAKAEAGRCDSHDCDSSGRENSGVVSGFSRAFDDVLVIGADTAVIVDDEILGKPVDAADAERMLRLLSGRAHLVMTGISVRGRDSEAALVEETQVIVRALGEDDIAWYIASREGEDKAGAYAIQGLASRFITRIEGSYSNVVGLPVAAVDELIQTVLRHSSVLASGM
jgi:septum formation protein